MSTLVQETGMGDFAETPFERQLRMEEERIYSHPDGWKVIAMNAIRDINEKLHLQWGHDDLSKAEMNEIGQVIQVRFRNKTNPVWGEEWSEFIVSRIIQRDGVRPSSVSAEVITGNDVMDKVPDEVDKALGEDISDDDDLQQDDDVVD